MAVQIRYPHEVYQKKDKNNKDWAYLDNIIVDDWQYLAICDIDNVKKTPSVIFAKKFNFNIPIDAAITSIQIDHDYHREASQTPIKITPPVFKIITKNKTLKEESHLNAEIHPIERTLTFNTDGLSPEDINDSDFEVEIIFPENKNKNEGLLFLDFIRVKIHYETKSYHLSAGETNTYFPDKNNPLEKVIGDTFKYSLYFRNKNGISEEKQAVKIHFSEGLEIENYYFKSGKTNLLDDENNSILGEDEFDTDNLIWHPAIRGKGVSAFRIVFKCTSEGVKKIYSSSENTDVTPNFYVNVFEKGHDSKVHEFEEKTLKWENELEQGEDLVPTNQPVSIKVDNVSMEFEMDREKVDNLKEYVIKSIKRDLKPKIYFKALKDVSFKINKGERVGIIGFNGAGKSTLLKILSGVLKPTKGKIYKSGKIAPLLELGAGFDHNYNGRENIFLNGAILGYSKEFLESKYDEIVEFSELEEFIEVPIKNYSSGMNAKLGFSIATIVEPEILILDEILSVGDVKFQKKSGDKLKQMMGSGTTVLLVSHSTAKIRELCNRAIWLDKGKLVMDGDVDYVCDSYIESAKKASENERMNLEFE